MTAKFTISLAFFFTLIWLAAPGICGREKAQLHSLVLSGDDRLAAGTAVTAGPRDVGPHNVPPVRLQQDGLLKQHGVLVPGVVQGNVHAHAQSLCNSAPNNINRLRSYLVETVCRTLPGAALVGYLLSLSQKLAVCFLVPAIHTNVKDLANNRRALSSSSRVGC